MAQNPLLLQVGIRLLDVNSLKHPTPLPTDLRPPLRLPLAYQVIRQHIELLVQKSRDTVHERVVLLEQVLGPYCGVLQLDRFSCEDHADEKVSALSDHGLVFGLTDED